MFIFLSHFGFNADCWISCLFTIRSMGFSDGLQVRISKDMHFDMLNASEGHHPTEMQRFSDKKKCVYCITMPDHTWHD